MYPAIASCAPSPRQGAIKLCRGSDIGTGSSLYESAIVGAFRIFFPNIVLYKIWLTPLLEEDQEKELHRAGDHSGNYCS